MTDTQKAREYGARCAIYLRMLDRAVIIAARQGAPCLPDRELREIAAQAWANAKLAAHHALKGD